ncbi:MAG: hypothetical protein OXM62_03155 [bacterium]|nr:hypothetical protein [bacterium]
MLRMLENYSVTWGGAGNLVIPTNGEGAVHSRLWPLIEPRICQGFLVR